MIPIDDDKTKTVETSNEPTENNDICTTHEDIHVKVESLETSNKNVYYYDDMIYNMFPDKPCLELHQGKKYNQKWFDLKDIENKGE